MNNQKLSRSSFADSALRLLERVEHRCASTSAEREAIYRFRYEAYRRENYIDPRCDSLLYDPEYDEAENCWIIGTFLDGALVGTLRVHVGTNVGDTLPDCSTFSDVISPHLMRGMRVMNTTRFATNLKFSRRFAEVPYLTLRAGWLAGRFFAAKFAVATARVEHLPFYKRVFGYDVWSEAREYPRVKQKVACIGLDYFAQLERVEQRYPFFRSTSEEREKVFCKQPDASSLTPDYETGPKKIVRAQV
jgi:hypothetical protein